MVRRGLGLSVLVLAGLVGLLAEPAARHAAEPTEVPGFEQVKIGMTTADVQRTLGPPNRIVRQVLYRRTLAQWTYQGKFPFWIEIEHAKGLEPRVRAVHQLRSGKNP